MRRAMACGLALGLATAAVGVRADGLNCCKKLLATGGCPGSCSADGSSISLDVHGTTAVELARQLSEQLGVEVRVQGIGFETLNLKLCAATPEAALTQVAQALHAHWRPAFIFGTGSVAAKAMKTEPIVTVTFHGAPASSAAYLTAAQVGGVLIKDRPLTGKVTFQGKNVPVSMAMDAVAVAAGVTWQPAYLLTIGPDTLVSRHLDHARNAGPGNSLQVRPGSPLTHLRRGRGGMEEVAPAPGMIVKDPQAELERIEKESLRRQQLGEWVTVFTQDSPKNMRRAARDLRIRVETTIQKLESYPPQNRELGVAIWRARYERMKEDFKHLTPEQQKLVQPVLDAMKFFEAPSN